MKYNILHTLGVCAVALSAQLWVACQGPTLPAGNASDGAPRQQTMFFTYLADKEYKTASPYTPQAFSYEQGETTPLTSAVTVSVSLSRPVEEEVTLPVTYDTEHVKKYLGNTNYKPLPKEMVSFTQEVKVEKEETRSSTIELSIDPKKAELEPNQRYYFALEVQPTAGIQVMEPHNLILYTVQATVSSVEVTKSVRLGQADYFALAKSFPSEEENVTLEGLICVEAFRTNMQISTFMGIEGGLLLRFGDSGKNQPSNKIQCNGQNVALTFETNQWYHIACVCEGNNTKVYINGELQQEAAASGSLTGKHPFYIGKSWDDARGIKARMAELRVWKVARTKEEIADNMYSVDPKTPGLLAYWKMDSADNKAVKDRTGNGYDLSLKSQQPGGSTKVEVFSEEDPIEVQPLN